MVNKHQVREFGREYFKAAGVQFSVYVSFAYFLPCLKPEGPYWYGAFLLLSILWGIYRARQRTNRMEFQVPASNSSLEIIYDDIFAGDGAIVIPVNEYFDAKLNGHVKERSLHGQFIKNVLGGRSEFFIALTSKALESVTPEETNVTGSSGQGNRYAIGTIAPVIHDRLYLLAVLAHTNLSSLKAFATIEDLCVCLAGVWNGIRDHSGGKSARVPLFGSGLSGIDLPTEVLTEIIVASFVFHTKKEKVTDKVTLVLPRHLRGKLDLNSIKRRWK